MDPANPLRSLAPTVDADVLFALARTHKATTGAVTAQRAGRSYAQVRHCLHRLVGTGLVLAEDHGNSVSYELNRAHVLAPVVEAAAWATSELEARIAQQARGWAVRAAAVVLFGPFARRDGDGTDDVRLLLVRPDDVDEDDPVWASQRHDLVRAIREWSGNEARVVERSVVDLAGATTHGDDVVVDLRRDGMVLVGPPLASLLATAASPL